MNINKPLSSELLRIRLQLILTPNIFASGDFTYFSFQMYEHGENVGCFCRQNSTSDAAARLKRTDPLQNDVRHRGVGVHDDGGGLVVSDLLQQRGGVLALVEHAHRQRLLGDEEPPEELLQVQKACW